MAPLRESFAEILQNVGVEDPNLVVLVGDISHFRLQPFAQKCPGRYYNVGICEPTIVNMAAGLSKVGFYPVIHTIAPFIAERSFEQIKLDFCYQKLGVNIIVVGSAFDYAVLGCTHHCYNDFAILKTLPDTELMYPSTYVELDSLFRQTYRHQAVKYFRAPMGEHPHAFKPGEIQFGKGVKIADGKNLTIVAVGVHLKTALEALAPLKNIGVEAEIIYIHTIKPFDYKIVNESLQKTRKCLVIEEISSFGGVFDDVLRHSKDLNGIKYASISIPNQFVREYGTYEGHCKRLGFTVEGIMNKVKNEL